MHICILNAYRKQHIYRVTLLLKEYTFIYLPHIEGLKGSLQMIVKLKLFLFSILISASSLIFAIDTDGDGIDDSISNCVSVSNTDQVDTDSDGTGNTCDAEPRGYKMSHLVR
jgi:Ni,Fe-hydrogenase I cytochrome b subunit